MFIFSMFVLFIAIAIFCLTQQKYTRATLFMLLMGLSFLLVVISIITYMSKNAYNFGSLYDYFGVTRNVQNQLMFLPISRYTVIRILIFSSLSFLYTGVCSAIYFAFPGMKIKNWRMLLLLAFPCIIQLIVYDPDFYTMLYYKLYPNLLSSRQFISMYQTIHQITFCVNTLYIAAGILLMFYALFAAPKVRLIRSNIIMILISFISLQAIFYYINYWSPEVMISVSKAANFVRFKPINLLGNPSMYAMLPYISAFCLLISLYGIYKYARIENRIRNQEAVISHNIDTASLTSRVFSHYMKNELLGILAQTELLEEMCQTNPEVVEEIQVIEERCRSIYDRLDVIHKKTLKSKMELQPISLHELVEKALKEHAMHLNKINILYTRSPQQLTIMADPEYFTQAIGNIIVNAAESLEYVPEKSRRIDLETIVKNKWVELIIRDNGSGIPEEQMKQIFQPFYSSKPTATNWGVGLSLCHTIIITHGGKIKVESKLGEGSVFRIIMPLFRNANN